MLTWYGGAAWQFFSLALLSDAKLRTRGNRQNLMHRDFYLNRRKNFFTVH